MKGQIFILFGVLILLTLFLLRISSPTTIEPSQAPLFDLFENIRQETGDSVELSVINGRDADANLGLLLSLTKSSLGRRGIEQTSQYTVTSSPGKTTVELNLTLKQGGSYISDTIIIERSRFV